MAKSKKKLPTVNAGDYVMCGGTRASYPSHWYWGFVVWADEKSVLIERGNLNGTETWREVVGIHEVRAVGTPEQVQEAKLRAAVAVQPFMQAVSDAESALGRARSALFEKLDEIATAEASIFSPDFDAIEKADAETRAAVEKYDEAEIATA